MQNKDDSSEESVHSEDSVERERRILEAGVNFTNFGLKLGKVIFFGVSYFLLSKIILNTIAKKVFKAQSNVFIWNIFGFVKH